MKNESAVDTTLSSSCSFLARRSEGIDAHPQKGEDGCEKDRPDDDNGRRPVLPAEQTLEEGIEMDNDPDREEELAKQGTP